MNILYKFIDALNFVICPPICVLCNQVIYDYKEGSEHICSDCLIKLPKPLGFHEILKRIDKHFGENNNPFSYAFSLYNSEFNHKFLELIHCLKYTKFKKIGHFLGKELGSLLAIEISKLGLDVHAIIPVPIHKVRRKERGFNQAEIIAQAIQSIINVPVKKNYLVRYVYTQSQTKLTLTERIRNVESAFRLNVDSNLIRGKNFLIVDDVITTGSTLFYCGKLLKENGANKLILAVLTTA